jgi:DNA polymerase/3'-5' exonuclease PolX
MKAKMPYSEALELAQKVVEILAPACERIEIAGSIRRQKPEVGDIEIVAISAKVQRYNMFMEPVGEVDQLSFDWAIKEAFLNGWRVLKNGPLYKQFNIGPCCLDLFITTPEKWGVIYTIRTGSADFSHRLMTPKRYGGMMPAWAKIADGRVWHGEQVLETPEEADVFKALGLDWIEPKDRI